MTKDEALMILTLVRTAWPRGSFPPETVRYWTELLGEYDYAAAQRAVSRLIKDRPWPVDNFAALHRAIADEMIGGPSAAAAYAQAIDVAHHRAEIEDLHPLVRQAIREVGGLWELRHTERPDMLRRSFIEQYESLLAAARYEIGEGRSWKALERARP